MPGMISQPATIWLNVRRSVLFCSPISSNGTLAVRQPVIGMFAGDSLQANRHRLCVVRFTESDARQQLQRWSCSHCHIGWLCCAGSNFSLEGCQNLLASILKDNVIIAVRRDDANAISQHRRDPDIAIDIKGEAIKLPLPDRDYPAQQLLCQ